MTPDPLIAAIESLQGHGFHNLTYTRGTPQSRQQDHPFSIRLDKPLTTPRDALQTARRILQAADPRYSLTNHETHCTIHHPGLLPQPGPTASADRPHVTLHTKRPRTRMTPTEARRLARQLHQAARQAETRTPP